MKFTELSVGILIVLSRRELDRVGILVKMKQIKGREISTSDFSSALTKLLNTELVSARYTVSAGCNVNHYSITLRGRQLIRSIKAGLLKRGKIG